LVGGEAENLRYLNRELSTLDYAARVLAMADDPAVALLERAKFLAFFSEHLDELFQLRVAGLKDQQAAGMSGGDGPSPAEQLRWIRRRVIELVRTQDEIFLSRLVPALADEGIVLSDWNELDDDDREHLVTVFEERMFPVLTPLAVDPAHPFPYVSHLSLNLAVIVASPDTGERRFARVKVPPLLPRFVVMPDGERFVAIEQVIAAHLALLFPGMVIESHHTFRVTRNADIDIAEDEADDLVAAIELELGRRGRRAVRLEVQSTMSDEVRELLARELEIEPEDVYAVDSPLDLSGLWAVHELNRPELKDEPWVPVTQARLAGTDEEGADIFGALRERDVLLHHPYDSFVTSVEAFVEQAALDPHVLTIKQTLYRTSGDSPVVRSLITAAQRGKQVAAVVELKARGDEQANIAWARALEEAGVHVVYGLVGLKTHAKAALVVRDEGGRLRRYCHLGTGNYNPRTARSYEDIGILTADPDLGADLSDLFNYLTGYSRQVSYRRIMVAPVGLRERIVDLVATQAHPQGRIVVKINNLVDAAVIDALYEASEAGARIDLIVRGICCLRPGVEGMSSNIRVRSIVGRYLEHSRVLAIGPPGAASYYIGSADLMPRNLDRRVEVVVPVDDPELATRIQASLDLCLVDDTSAWSLGPDGVWTKLPTIACASSQQRLHEMAAGTMRRRRDTAL
jgi:polyphosphate kinase